MNRNLHIALAWAALIALMLTSLGSAYVPLGRWNLVIGVVIAAIKSMIVLFVFMGLVRGPAVLRLAAAIGLATLVLLFALSGVDYATRSVEPAAMQQPQQLERNTAKGEHR
jgi:cytochrome c oxidase subunit 4